MEFQKIAMDYIEFQTEDIEDRICPDQYVGKISDFSNSQKDFPERTTPSKRPNQKCLLMILESPHTKEFNGELGPAKGKTGDSIRKWIKDAVGIPNIDDYGLIIINAIQYQCSLGKSTNCYRDEMFMKSWNNFGENNFLERLNNIYRNDDMIVNCCTKGNITNNELRKKVHETIVNMDRINTNVVLLRRTHPSSWWNKKNRDSEWSC